MISAYFDESGTDRPKATALVVGGYVGPASLWSAFSQIWAGVLAREGVSAYHATDLEFPCHQEFEGWELARAIQFRQALIDAFVIPADCPLAAGIRYTDFERDEQLKGIVRSPYTLCAMYCVLNAVDWARASGYGEPLVFVFEKGGPAPGELTDFMDALSETEPLVTTPAFRDRRRVLPLQAADFNAYESWKHFENRFVGGIKRDTRKSVLAALQSGMRDDGLYFLDRDTYQPLIEEMKRLRVLVDRKAR
jgi:hypothetical protein